jgi:hypothetical protein
VRAELRCWGGCCAVQTMEASRILTQASRVRGGGVGAPSVQRSGRRIHGWLVGGTGGMGGWGGFVERHDHEPRACRLRCLRSSGPSPARRRAWRLSPLTVVDSLRPACLPTLRSLALLLVAACPHSSKLPPSFLQASARLHARQTIMLALGSHVQLSSPPRYIWRQQRTWGLLQGTTTLQGTASS